MREIILIWVKNFVQLKIAFLEYFELLEVKKNSMAVYEKV